MYGQVELSKFNISTCISILELCIQGRIVAIHYSLQGGCFVR